MFITDSTAIGCENKLCCCKSRAKNKSTESEDESYTPPEIGWSSAVCHLPLSQQAHGFQLLEDSGSSKHLIGSKLIHGVESRMQQYISIEPSMKIKAARNYILCDIAQIFY